MAFRSSVVTFDDDRLDLVQNSLTYLDLVGPLLKWRSGGDLFTGQLAGLTAKRRLCLGSTKGSNRWAGVLVGEVPACFLDLGLGTARQLDELFTL
jgi:hypothetical protein